MNVFNWVKHELGLYSVSIEERISLFIHHCTFADISCNIQKDKLCFHFIYIENVYPERFSEFNICVVHFPVGGFQFYFKLSSSVPQVPEYESDKKDNTNRYAQANRQRVTCEQKVYVHADAPKTLKSR